MKSDHWAWNKVGFIKFDNACIYHQCERNMKEWMMHPVVASLVRSKIYTAEMLISGEPIGSIRFDNCTEKKNERCDASKSR